MEGEVRFTLLDEDGVEKEVKVFFFHFFSERKLFHFWKKNCFYFFLILARLSWKLFRRIGSDYR